MLMQRQLSHGWLWKCLALLRKLRSRNNPADTETPHFNGSVLVPTNQADESCRSTALLLSTQPQAAPGRTSKRFGPKSCTGQSIERNYYRLL